MTPNGEQPRAPMAPLGDMADTTPRQSVRLPRPLQPDHADQPARAPGMPLPAEPSQPAVHTGNEAWGEETFPHPAAPVWPVRPAVVVERAREHPIRTAALVGVALVGLALCCTGGIWADSNLELRGTGGTQTRTIVPTEGPTTTATTGTEGTYACSPAKDMGGFPNGTTINTNGEGGAIVDDTQPGQQTQVTFIPKDTRVKLNGAVHEWLFSEDCTPDQILAQAQNHATQAGDQFVSDYHQLDGIGSTGSRIPTADARYAAFIEDLHANIQARRLARAQK